MLYAFVHRFQLGSRLIIFLLLCTVIVLLGLEKSKSTFDGILLVGYRMKTKESRGHRARVGVNVEKFLPFTIHHTCTWLIEWWNGSGKMD